MRRLQTQTLPDEAPPPGKTPPVHQNRHNFWPNELDALQDLDFPKKIGTLFFMTEGTIFKPLGRDGAVKIF